MTHQQIAEAFSLGKFHVVFTYLAETVEWVVVGERHLKGKESVKAYCKQVASYFNSVTTDFNVTNVISDKYKIAVTGSANFIREGKIINKISSCDVYEFNPNSQLTHITSYCISEPF